MLNLVALFVNKISKTEIFAECFPAFIPTTITVSIDTLSKIATSSVAQIVENNS